MPHDKYLEERSHQRSVVASDLLAALQALSHAHAINRHHDLGLSLPSVEALRDAIDKTAEAHRKETQPI